MRIFNNIIPPLLLVSSRRARKMALYVGIISNDSLQKPNFHKLLFLDHWADCMVGICCMVQEEKTNCSTAAVAFAIHNVYLLGISMCFTIAICGRLHTQQMDALHTKRKKTRSIRKRKKQGYNRAPGCKASTTLQITRWIDTMSTLKKPRLCASCAHTYYYFVTWREGGANHNQLFYFLLYPKHSQQG